MKVGLFGHRSRFNGINNKLTSDVWKKFHVVYNTEEDCEIDSLYFCTDCEHVIYNTSCDGNTNIFHRHRCTTSTGKERSSILVSTQEKEKLKRGCASFVSLDLRPYHSVDCEGFFLLACAIMQFGQKYPKATEKDLQKALPCRNTVKSIVGDIASEVRKQIRDILQRGKDVNGFGVTTDCWSDKFKHTTYMCITVHINTVELNGIRRHRYIIHLDEITEFVKSKQVLIHHICKIFAQYGFSEEDIRKFCIFLSDRGPNVRYGLEGFGLIRLNCYAHLINNLVKFMLEDPTVKSIIQSASTLASYLKNAGLNQHLKSTVKTYSKTRWNCVYVMLATIVKNHDGIFDVLSEKQRAMRKNDLLPMITVLNMCELTKICNFLETFKSLTDLLEGDINETLHYVWPSYYSIKELLEENPAAYDDNDPTETLINVLKRRGIEYMQKNASDFKPTIHHKVAAVLHPLMRALPKIDDSKRESIYKEVEEIIHTYKTNESSAPRIHQPQENSSLNRQPAVIRDFFVCDTNNNVDNSPSNDHRSELQKYLESNICMQDMDLKTWWFNNKNVYPTLFKVFVRYSSVPATSAPSERAFSDSGLVVTNRRSTILPANVNDIIIARNKLIKHSN